MTTTRSSWGKNQELTDKADDLFVKWDDSFRYEIEGAPYQVIYQVSEYTGWKTIGILPDKEISNPLCLCRQEPRWRQYWVFF